MIDPNVNVLIIEDHMIVRAGLVALLRNIGFENIHEAGSISEVESVLASQQQIGLALLDLDLPDSSGLDTIKKVMRIDKGLPILLLTAKEDTTLMVEAYACGVLGFITKSSSVKVIIAAIDIVLAGGKYVPKEVLNLLVPSFETQTSKMPKDEFEIRCERLTSRQKEIYEQMLMGRSNKEIARSMEITPGTVKVHVSAILRALNVESRSKALSLLNRTFKS